MSRRAWGAARELLPLAVLIVAAAWPVLAGGPPAEVDGAPHFYRFVALDHALAQGVLYPRWLPDLHYGFGAPLLNYYAPAAYYLLVLLRLGGLPYPWAFAAGFLLVVAGMAAGLYVWARAEFASPQAALAAAGAYVFSPYVYKTALERAALPELLALALLPWLGWLLWRWARRPTAAGHAALAAGAALLLLSHSVSVLLFAPLLGVYTLLQLPGTPGAGRKLGGLALVGVQALLLAAFFLVPLVAQAGAVQWERATAVAQYQNSFLRLSELLAWPIAYDAAHITNLMPNSLGWPQVALALGAVAALWVTRARPVAWPAARVVTGVVAATLLCGWLTLRGSAGVWQALPFLGRLQFPWRWLAPATLGLAWLAGAAVARLGPRWRPAALGATLAGCYLFSLSWSFHAPFAPFPSYPTGADNLRAQVADRFYTFEFLPRTVRQLPPADTLAARYAAGDPPDRLRPLPAGLTVLEATPGPLAQTVRYQATAAAMLTWYQFAYPGWQATLDGAALPVSVVGPEGWLGVATPAGAHTVRVFFGATAATRAGTLLSAVGLAAWLVVAGAARRARGPAPQRAAMASGALSPAWAALLAGLLLARVAVIERVETPWTYSPLNHRQPVTPAQFAELSVIGVDYPHGATAQAGQAWPVEVFWQASAPPQQAYKTVIVLWSGDGRPVAQHDNYLPAGYPTLWWQPGQYGRDVHILQLPENLPPGDYTLTAGLYYFRDDDPSQLVTVSYQAEQGAAGASYPIGGVTLSQKPP
ncbi:MAG: hypothetical protein IT317_23265 [Anaerolineales bacterium]|nr:hypothetical protein [Anaerolineales bacterium]